MGDAIQSHHLKQRGTEGTKNSFPTFQLTSLVPSLSLTLKYRCWRTPTSEKVTGSVTSLSPLLKHQNRAAYKKRKKKKKIEKKRKRKKGKTAEWDIKLVALSSTYQVKKTPRNVPSMPEWQ